MMGITCRVCGMNCERWSRNQGLICKPCHLARRREYYRAVRRDKELEYQRQYYLKNKEKVDARNRKYQKEHPEVVSRLTKAWHARNPRNMKERDRRVVTELRQSYVAHRLGISAIGADPVLIEAKRLQILITRKLKETENEEHQGTA